MIDKDVNGRLHRNHRQRSIYQTEVRRKLTLLINSKSTPKRPGRPVPGVAVDEKTPNSPPDYQNFIFRRETMNSGTTHFINTCIDDLRPSGGRGEKQRGQGEFTNHCVLSCPTRRCQSTLVDSSTAIYQLLYTSTICSKYSRINNRTQKKPNECLHGNNSLTSISPDLQLMAAMIFNKT